MGRVESLFFEYLRRQSVKGQAVSITEAMKAVVPAEHPEFAQRAAYRYALERLHTRYLIHAISNRDGVLYYYLDSPSMPSREQILRTINERLPGSA